MFQTKAVKKIKTRILCSITFSRKSCHLLNNMEKYTKAREATDNSIIWYRQYAICIPDN